MNKRDIIACVNDRLAITSYPVKQISDSEHSAPVIHAILDVLLAMHGEEMDEMKARIAALEEKIK